MGVDDDVVAAAVAEAGFLAPFFLDAAMFWQSVWSLASTDMLCYALLCFLASTDMLCYAMLCSWRPSAAAARHPLFCLLCLYCCSKV